VRNGKRRSTGSALASAVGWAGRSWRCSGGGSGGESERRERRPRTGGGPITTGYFVHDGDQIVLELESDGDVAHRLLWGPAVDEALADETGAGSTYWYLTDHLGTVRDVAAYSGGVTTIANHIAFDSFGRRASETNTALGDFDLGFTGKWLDRATGLQWNLNRWYSPSIQRWMSEDPIGFAAGDPNLNRYVGNMPVMYTDPSGLYWPGYPYSPHPIMTQPDPVAEKIAEGMAENENIVRPFVCGVAKGAGTAVLVVGAVVGSAAVGVPGGVITAGLWGLGVFGAIRLGEDVYNDPSTENIAENVGSVVGSGVVGCFAARPINNLLSPPGNRTPTGQTFWEFFKHEWNQVFWPRPNGKPWVSQIWDAMDQGPTLGGAGGAFTIIGSGFSQDPNAHKRKPQLK
jgi:RHS repeat-associated protein